MDAVPILPERYEEVRFAPPSPERAAVIRLFEAHVKAVGRVETKDWVYDWNPVDGLMRRPAWAFKPNCKQNARVRDLPRTTSQPARRAQHHSLSDEARD